MLQVGIDLRLLDLQSRVTILPRIELRRGSRPTRFRFPQAMPQFFEAGRHFDNGHAQTVAFENQLIARFTEIFDGNTCLRLLLVGFGNLLHRSARTLFQFR